MAYKWEYPHKLLIDFHGKLIAIKFTSQATRFKRQLNKEEVEIGILNPSLELPQSDSQPLIKFKMTIET